MFALAVIVSHSTELAGGSKDHEFLYRIFHTVTLGELAVDAFFLLSGYLIVQSWMTAPDLWRFLKSRILRIYPGFIVATLICVFLVGPLGTHDPRHYFSELSLATVAGNMLRLLQPESPPVFEGQSYALLNGAMWTISYEFKCYLAVLVLGVIGVLRRRALVLTLTAVIMLIFASQKFGFALPAPKGLIEWASLRTSTFRFAAFFFTGTCFYLLRPRIKLDGWIATMAAATLLATMLMGWAPLLEIELPILGGYLLFYAGFKPITALADFDKLPDISYGVYLYGWPVQKLLLWYFPAIPVWLLMLLSSLAAIGLGLMSWHTIEKPCLRWKSATLLRKKTEAVERDQPEAEGASLQIVQGKIQ